MRHLLHFLLLGLFCVAWARAASAQPLRNGEQLTYRVSWAIIPGAGEIKIDAAAVPGTPEQLVVTTTTSTRGLARMLLTFRARNDAVFDIRLGRMLSLREQANNRGKETDHRVVFDYGKREATYSGATPAAPDRVLPMPEGNPTDLIMALLQTRTWDLKPGEKRDALVLFDDDFYELTLHALRYENVRSGIGLTNTLVLEPRMEKTPPKGMFRRGSTVKVWISQDEKKLPVKFEVEFKFGTGTATLDRHVPPAGGNAAPPPGAPAAAAPSSAPSSAAPDAKNPRP